MDFELLISAMYLKNVKLFLQERNINSNVVIINQCDQEKVEILKYKNYTVKIYSTMERGLSKSRNMALKMATAKYVLLADDDIKYVKNYVEIMENFIAREQASIYIFRILKENKLKWIPKKIGYLSIFRVYSPEILIKREDILDCKICFDENFGIGANYTCGEETIFLSDCLKKKLKIINSNELIGLEVKNRPSYWYNGLNEFVLESTGAAMTRMNKYTSVFLIFQFCVRKHALYNKENISFLLALKIMYRARAKICIMRDKND